MSAEMLRFSSLVITNAARQVVRLLQSTTVPTMATSTSSLNRTEEGSAIQVSVYFSCSWSIAKFAPSPRL